MTSCVVGGELFSGCLWHGRPSDDLFVNFVDVTNASTQALFRYDTWYDSATKVVTATGIASELGFGKSFQSS